ncbi:MAG: hypothetical protein U1A27_03540 [Phycisphaerae bacterium]
MTLLIASVIADTPDEAIADLSAAVAAGATAIELRGRCGTAGATAWSFAASQQPDRRACRSS